jgi:acyl-CoA thioesterase
VGSFGVETGVERAGEPGDGRWVGEIDPVWNLRPLPQGGIVTAVALRALEAELDDPNQTLRTLHTTFAAQVAHGPVEVDVEVLRRGRSMSHLRGEIRNAGSPRGHLTTAIFGGPRKGFDFTDLVVPPGVPHPDDCPSFRDPPPDGIDVPRFEPMPFWEEKVEGRVAIGVPHWDDSPRTTSLNAKWSRFDDPPRRDDGTIDPFAAVVVADTMPGAVGQRVGPSDEMWFSPSVDLTFHLMGEWRSEWILGVNAARWAGDGYASVDMALWDLGDDCRSTPHLVAYATQLCLFTFLPSPS